LIFILLIKRVVVALGWLIDWNFKSGAIKSRPYKTWCCHALNNKNTPLQCHYQGWCYLSLSLGADESVSFYDRIGPASERLLVGNVPT
jgi:hypothetical protein